MKGKSLLSTMSRFFATGGSDSESESSSEEEQIITRPAAPTYSVNFNLYNQLLE